MAKNTKRQDDLVTRLRKSGLRKRAAELIAQTTDGRRKPARRVRAGIGDLRKLVADLEDRAQGGPAKRKASAKKAANTRKRKAKARSESAKKGAKTRAKK